MKNEIKIVYIALVMLFVPLYVSGQNIENRKFIIPQDSSSIIAQFENNSIKEVGKIDIPYPSKSVFLENLLFVSLCFGEEAKDRKLIISDEHGKKIFEKTEYKFDSINFKGNVVYLGGQYEKENELFSFIDLTKLDSIINKIFLPIKKMKGKSIDDILIRDNALYLVDNLVFPKYILKYDITTPNKPKHKKTSELQNNGSYEHIIKGDISENWVVLFSSSWGRFGDYAHLSIVGKDENWKRENSLGFYYGWGRGEFDALPGVDRDFYKVLDICLIDDTLLVLKEDALYSIKLTDKIAKEKLIQIEKNREEFKKLMKIEGGYYLLINRDKYKLLKI